MRRLCCTAALGILSAVSLATGQTARNTTGIIVGTVSDTTLRPIGGADVNFAGTSVRATTDSLGRFKIVNVPSGKFILLVRIIGFRPVSDEIEIADHDTLRLAFTLERTTQELSTVIITERKLSARLSGFESRRKLGFGTFFNREQIDSINPISIGDIVRRANSVRVQRTGFGGMGEIAVSSREVGLCPMQIYLDGLALGPTDLTFLPPPSAIAAIEIYPGSATLPTWIAQGPPTTNRGCGAILFWTTDV